MRGGSVVFWQSKWYGGGDFANAREVRNFFESAVVSQADWLYGQTGLSDEDLCRLEESDFKYKERMIE